MGVWAALGGFTTSLPPFLPSHPQGRGSAEEAGGEADTLVESGGVGGSMSVVIIICWEVHGLVVRAGEGW